MSRKQGRVLSRDAQDEFSGSGIRSLRGNQSNTFHMSRGGGTKDCDKKVKNSLGHPPAGGDAGHDDALRSRGGHSLESPLPKLLKELLLFQLVDAAGAALRSQGRRGAKLERTWGLHLCCSGAVQVLNQNTHIKKNAQQVLLRRLLVSQQRVNVSARLSALGSCSGSVGRGTKADPSPTGVWVLFSQMREGGVGEIVFLSPPLLFCHICCLFGTGEFFFWGWGGGGNGSAPFSGVRSRRQFHTGAGITHKRQGMVQS